MRVQLLSPYPQDIADAVIRAGDHIVSEDPEFIVSYGHREIIREPMLSQYAGRLINIHISYLPWNRGSDPNFWSWLDHTPKGVTIHQIDAGLDTGDILVQREVAFSDDDTLATSYAKLRAAAAALFAESWGQIRSGSIIPKPQHGRGSYHRSRDKEPYFSKLPLRFDTPVKAIAKARR